MNKGEPLLCWCDPRIEGCLMLSCSGSRGQWSWAEVRQSIQVSANHNFFAILSLHDLPSGRAKPRAPSVVEIDQLDHCRSEGGRVAHVAQESGDVVDHQFAATRNICHHPR